MRTYLVRIWEPDRDDRHDTAPRGFVQDLTEGMTRRFVGLSELLDVLGVRGQEGNRDGLTSIWRIKEE